MQSELFTFNSRSNFQTYVHLNDLSYLADSDDIEVAIKSITIDNDLYGEKSLALKSNLSFDTISSFGWDNIISIFSVNHKRKGGVYQISFTNPTFFPTTRERISRASFKIIDLKTQDQPNFSIGSPTFIEVAIRNQKIRMKQPFHILLDSSCEESKKRFPKNTNMEFCVQLPKRMEFKRDWMICLKSIHFCNKFQTLQDCSITIQGVKDDGINKWNIKLDIGKKFPYNTNKLIKLLNRSTKGFLVFILDPRGYLAITADARYNTGKYGEVFQVEFSNDLKTVLGLDNNHYQIIKSLSLDDISISLIKSTYKVNVYALHPHHFIVCCDLVEESILGGERVQVLKYFPRKLSNDSVVDLEFSNNDYLKLNLKNFDRIRIRIADISGKTVLCDPSIPTRMQLLFVNTNN